MKELDALNANDMVELLESFAHASGLEFKTEMTPDGWDFEAVLGERSLGGHLLIIYLGVGFPIQDAYKNLIQQVMMSNEWTDLAQMRIWIDLNSVCNETPSVAQVLSIQDVV